MVTLEKITETNFRQIVNMKLPEAQDKFVAPNLYSLAQAWLYYDEARPYAVYADNEVVGFLMFSWDEKERGAGVWRFMIAHEHQHKGYGRKAMELAIDIARKAQNIDFMFLDYVEGNTVARDLYYSLGFRETGEIIDGEVIMKMTITDQPLPGATVADQEDCEEIIKLLQKQNLWGSQNLATLTEEKVKQLAEQEQLVRICMLGETVGIACNDELLIEEQYESILPQVRDAIAKARN